MQTLSCGEILSQIEEDIACLTSNLRDVPERHRSLRAVLEHTWRSLTVDERHALACLSAFRGGFRHRAADEVAEAGLEMLRRLSDKSLVQRDPGGRYHLHELLDRYAAERLEADGAESAVEQRHLSFFLQLAETAASQLRGPKSAQWLARLAGRKPHFKAQDG